MLLAFARRWVTERFQHALLRGTRPGRAVTPQFRTPGVRSVLSDTQTDMLLGEPKSAICVQRFDDSLNSAIHTTYRSWLRSSSIREPRDPPLKVVSRFFSFFPLQPAGSRRRETFQTGTFKCVKCDKGGAGRTPNRRTPDHLTAPRPTPKWLRQVHTGS